MSVPSTNGAPDAASHVLAKIRTLTREVGRLTSERDRLSSQLRESRSLEEELREERGRLQVRLRDHEFREEELVRKEESLERQLAMFKQRVVQLSEEREGLENKLSNSQGATDSLYAGRDSLVARLEAVESELSTVRLEQETTKRKVTEAESELTIIRRENATLTDTLSNVESTRLKLASDKGELDGAFREVHEKLSSTTEERDRLSGELEETRGIKNQLQEELDRLVFRSRREYLRFGMVALTVVAIACFVFWAFSALFNWGVKKDIGIAEGKIKEMESKITSYLGKLSEKNKDIIVREEEIEEAHKARAVVEKELEGLQESFTSFRKEYAVKNKTASKDRLFLQQQAEEKYGALELERDSQVAALQDKLGVQKRMAAELRRSRARAIEPLIEALNHPDPNVRVSASTTLTEFTGKLFGPNQKKWRDWWLRNRLKYLQ